MDAGQDAAPAAAARRCGGVPPNREGARQALAGGPLRRHLPCLGLLWLLAAAPPRPALADKPCGEDSWFADPRRPAARYARLATWVAVGQVLGRAENRVPYPNCALPDRSRCAQWDRSVLTVRVERYEKGRGPATLVLTAERCAPDPPAEVGGRFRFFGREPPDSYLMLEAVPRSSKPGPGRAP